MNMDKEKYECLKIDVTFFEVKDVILTSDTNPPEFNPDNPWEQPYKP